MAAAAAPSSSRTNPIAVGGASGVVMGGDNNSMVAARQSSTQVLPSHHLDYIFKVSFDTYGRRMATCSADRFVRVWDLTDNGSWTLVAQWQAHQGAVTCLAWAHPEFGSLLATCGSDYDTKIWEERNNNPVTSMTSNSTNNNNPSATSSIAGANLNSPSSPSMMNSAGHAGGGGNAMGTATPSLLSSRWTARASLTEARRAVSCLEFAPRHWGLKLATGSADGCVRVYEAVDLQNVSQWLLTATLEAFAADNYNSTTVGSSGGSGTHVPPSGGGGSGSGSGYLQQHVGCTSLSWCNGRFEPPTLVVGGSGRSLSVTPGAMTTTTTTTTIGSMSSSSSSSSAPLIIYRYSEAARAWQPILQLASVDVPPMTMPSYHANKISTVLDVAWAPNVGRRFHYIAAAEENCLRIYKLLRQTSVPSGGDASNSSGGGFQPATIDANNNKLKEAASLLLDSSQTIVTNAWRCQWNVTGTVLASSGDGGIVQLWKANPAGQFVCVSTVQGDLHQAMAANDTPAHT